jgi:hypothetical protein
MTVGCGIVANLPVFTNRPFGSPGIVVAVLTATKQVLIRLVPRATDMPERQFVQINLLPMGEPNEQSL